MGLNAVQIQGRVTKDLELQTVGEDRQVINFSIANNRGYGDKKRTAFVDCVLWGKPAETFVKYVKKGTEVLLEGQLEQDTWEKDGERRSKIRILVNNFHLIGSSNNNAKDEERKY